MRDKKILQGCTFKYNFSVFHDGSFQPYIKLEMNCTTLILPQETTRRYQIPHLQRRKFLVCAHCMHANGTEAEMLEGRQGRVGWGGVGWWRGVGLSS
jgi:hypothetical protein